MRHLTGAVIRDITGGETRGELLREEITDITTDSRTVTPGCLFAAIPGARVDGHDFIATAAEKGASCVLCSRFVDCDIPQIKVEDTRAALGSVAAFYRSQFELPVFGVTGSVGKTTAKEMIGAVLSQGLNTLKTKGNFNNDLGVPLTLFRLREEHEAAVIEMGISGFGEMTYLADMVRPQIAVFTLIGDAHLEFLGDRAGVLRAKSEIIGSMPEDGLVIANGDDPLLKAHDFGRETWLVGLGEDCALRATEIENDGLGGVRCVIEGMGRRIPAEIPALGEHMVYAALLGAAAGIAMHLDDEQIRRGIGGYAPVGGRGRVVQTDRITILDDSYNANPTSMKNALDNLKTLPGRHVAILGDMRELGEDAPAMHRELGRYAAETGAVVIACGELSKETAAGAGEGTRWFESTPALIEALPALIRPEDAVLVKASLAMDFKSVVAALEEMKF